MTEKFDRSSQIRKPRCNISSSRRRQLIVKFPDNNVCNMSHVRQTACLRQHRAPRSGGGGERASSAVGARNAAGPHLAAGRAACRGTCLHREGGTSVARRNDLPAKREFPAACSAEAGCPVALTACYSRTEQVVLPEDIGLPMGFTDRFPMLEMCKRMRALRMRARVRVLCVCPVIDVLFRARTEVACMPRRWRRQRLLA